MSKKVVNYAVRVNGGPQGLKNGIRSQIHVFGESNKLVGYINFHQPSKQSPLPKDVQGSFITMNLPLAVFGSIVDLLRNEDPVYIAFNEQDGYAYMSTGAEPTGEGE